MVLTLGRNGNFTYRGRKGQCHPHDVLEYVRDPGRRVSICLALGIVNRMDLILAITGPWSTSTHWGRKGHSSPLAVSPLLQTTSLSGQWRLLLMYAYIPCPPFILHIFVRLRLTVRAERHEPNIRLRRRFSEMAPPIGHGQCPPKDPILLDRPESS